jgi:hypothetical protein
VHAPVSLVNFRMFKSHVKVTQRQRSFRIEIFKMEPPSSCTSTARKIVVERMKDSSFLIVIVKFTAFMLNNLDLVSTVRWLAHAWK